MDLRFNALVACCALGALPPAGAADPLGALAAEDRTYLLKNVHRLSSRASLELDRETGDLTVVYCGPSELKADIIVPPDRQAEIQWSVPVDRSHLPLPGQLPFWPNRPLFLGSKSGTFYLPFPFQGPVTIEMGLEIGMKRHDGNISLSLRSLKDPATFTYPLGVDLNAGEWIPITRTLEAPAGGALVGIEWNNIKFSARGLKLRGKLAARQAVQILRDELRVRGPAPLDLPPDPQGLPAPLRLAPPAAGPGGGGGRGGHAALFSTGRFV
jgi:hypothetical protein